MSESKLGGRSVLLIVPANQFRDEEVFETRRILAAAGARVVVGSQTVRTCHGMKGGTIEAEVSIGDATGDGWDAIVLSGGSSVPAVFWTDKALIALVSKMSEEGKLVAATSLSTVVLARARLLEGKSATVYHLPEAIQELRDSGATYVKQPVVADGRIVTAEGPENVAGFAEAIVSALA